MVRINDNTVINGTSDSLSDVLIQGCRQNIYHGLIDVLDARSIWAQNAGSAVRACYFPAPLPSPSTSSQ